MSRLLLLLAVLPTLALGKTPDGYRRIGRPLSNTFAKTAIDFVVSQNNAKENNMFYRKLVTVGNVYAKIDNGMFYYKLEDVVLGDTDCTKSQTTVKDLKDCNLTSGGNKISCNFDVSEIFLKVNSLVLVKQSCS